MIEIERKYLVLNNDFIAQATTQNRIVQGYISSNPERTVRVRIKGEKGFLTIKGIGSQDKTSRFEWESQIDINDAKQLLQLCEKGIIDKIRYEIPSGKHIVEVDVFEGENKGLIIAEIELENENEEILKPAWLGVEVTQDERFFNAYLSKNPFLGW